MAPFKDDICISPIIKASLTVQADSQQRFKLPNAGIITAKIAGSIH